MTDSIFAKFILTIASIFTVLTGPSYIKVTENELNFNFKTGDLTPIYYLLNVENVGLQKARFDVSSNVNWLFVYREGQQQQTDFVSVELPQYAPINFVLEIHPERLEDKTHQTEIAVKAIQLQDYSVLDTKKISVVLNKNTEATAAPIVSPIETGQTPPPILSPVPQLTSAPAPVSPTKTPAPKAVSPSLPTPKGVRPPTSDVRPSPSPEIKPILKPLKVLIDSLKSFVRILFRF